MGTIRTYTPDFNITNNHEYAIYPEIQISSILLSSPFYWHLYLGYWDDQVKNQLAVADLITYSTKSKILGVRFALQLSDFERDPWLNVGYFVGLSKHYLNNKYIGGADYAGNRGTNHSTAYGGYEVGISLNKQIRDVNGILVEFNRYYTFRELGGQILEGRNSFKCGIYYTL